MIRIVLLFALYAVVAAFRSVPVNRIVTTRVNLFGNNEPSRDNGNMPAKKDGGLFGGMGNLMESMKKAQEIAKQAEVMNKELSSQVVQGTDPSQRIVCTFNGLTQPVSIQIPDDMAAQGGEAVSLAATQAMVDAYSKSALNMQRRMAELYGMQIPPEK